MVIGTKQIFKRDKNKIIIRSKGGLLFPGEKNQEKKNREELGGCGFHPFRTVSYNQNMFFYKLHKKYAKSKVYINNVKIL